MLDTPVAAAQERGPAVLTGARRKLDVAYGYLSAAFALGVLVQIYLAGVGAFGEHKKPHSGSFDPHENLGHILGVVAVVLFALALIARPSRRVMAWTFVLALLTEVAQAGLADGGRSDKWVGGFHAFDAALILAISIGLLISWRRRKAAR
jgi:hypothetical protein